MFLEIPLSLTQWAIVCSQEGNENETLPPEDLYSVGVYVRKQVCLLKLQEAGLQGANRISITLVTVIIVKNIGFQIISLSVYFKC